MPPFLKGYQIIEKERDLSLTDLSDCKNILIKEERKS